MLDQTRLDGVVVAFTLGVSVLRRWRCSVQCRRGMRAPSATWPAASARKPAAPRAIRSASGRAALLIVAETTLAVVLLVGAGLLTRSFARLLAVDLGFSADAVQTFSISLPDSRYGQPQLRQEFVETLLRARRHASRCRIRRRDHRIAADQRPASGSRHPRIDGVTLSDDEQDRLTLQVRVVTPDYFKTLAIPIKQGRGFTAADRIGSQPVLLLNETAAQRIWPGGIRAWPPVGDRHRLRAWVAAGRAVRWSAWSAT